ncbi:hypothetical protein [Poseidonocella pacifica]|nr:hypothetical protein [Poseidonocella pacifica]
MPLTRFLSGCALLGVMAGCAPTIPDSGNPVIYQTSPQREAALAGEDFDTAAPQAGAEAVGASGISAENDFERVGELRTIESDAQRMERLRQQYQVVQPTAVPSRTNSGPNIVQYAVSTRHAPGTPIYSRLNLRTAAAHQRKCASYASADQAQLAFLSAGGPDRDKLGLDPDGDGFACDWDPSPFRRAVGG